jgi:transcriptional regulator with XRE-family HTH domain
MLDNVIKGIYILMDLIKKLDQYRLEKKITQQKLATLLEVSFVTVNRWLTGKTKPSKIQEYHIEKLLAGENEDEKND